MPARKAAKPRKQPRNTRALVPQPHGGALKPGGDGVSGGRPKDEFKEWCRGLLDAPSCRQQVQEILGDKAHPAFKAMWAAVADRAHGKPKESVDMNLNGEVTVKQEWTFGKRKVGF